MTLDDLIKQVLAIMPDAIIETDKTKELIIASGLMEDEGILVPIDNA